MKKKLTSLILILGMILSLAIPTNVYAKDDGSIVETDEEFKAVWLSVYDFSPLGMANKSEGSFKKAVSSFMKIAKNYGFNAIILQVRANDDALWPSEHFAAVPEFCGRHGALASRTYRYDPLEIFVDAAHDKDLELHAWINPYRINKNIYLDPALPETRSRINMAVKELLDYDIDGMHMDDYFYHASQGYVSPSNTGAVYPVGITNTQKCANVNTFVRSLYKICHNNDIILGISPQGNMQNNVNSGADVATWLSAKGYVDYVSPQIYWTDSSAGASFSTHLADFTKLKRNSAKIYPGLALYRACSRIGGDPGWAEKQNNLALQVKTLRKNGCTGFLVFSARFLIAPDKMPEMYNLAPLLHED